MMKTDVFNYSYYSKILKQPDWYLKLERVFEHYFFLIPPKEERTEDQTNFRKAFITLLEEKLEAGEIALGSNVDFDSSRKNIDTVVIHHSSMDSEISLAKINAFQLINLYARTFLMKSKDFYGCPVTSGHYYDGNQIFIAYHYIIMPNGTMINPLKDEYIGWHCGNWDYNCRSIAICFHDDLNEREPTDAAITSALKIIKKYKPKEILGHREILSSTICPGNKFLGESGWKNKLVA